MINLILWRARQLWLLPSIQNVSSADRVCPCEDWTCWLRFLFAPGVCMCLGLVCHGILWQCLKVCRSAAYNLMLALFLF